jgi:O-antigen/teichoic acid export membrane protein
VGIIGFAQLLTSLGAFLLLPIITKTLGPYDYGLWSQIIITVHLISPIALLGMSMSAVRFLSAETEPDTIREGFYSILCFVTFTGLCASLLVYFFSDTIASTVFQDISASYYIRIASWLILLNVISQITLFYFRIFHQIKTFALMLIIQTLGRLFLVYALILIGLGLYGVIIGTVAVWGFVFLLCIARIVQQIGFIIPKFSHLREYLNYGAPLTPNNLIRWVTDSSDRYLVGYFLNLQAVGIYSASYTIGYLIQFFVAPLQFVLLPELSRFYDQNNMNMVKQYLSRSLKYFLLITIPSVFGLSVLATPILTILTTEEFISGSVVIPLIALSGLFAGVFQIVINIALIIKKTKFPLLIQLSAASVNVILNIFLIPMIGILGAAIATLASYLLMVASCIYISFQFIPFDLNKVFILKSIAASSVMGGILYFLHPINILQLIATILIGIIVYFAVLLFIKGLEKGEILMIKDLMFK